MMKLESVKKEDKRFSFKPMAVSIGVALMLTSCANNTPSPDKSKTIDRTQPTETNSSNIEVPPVTGGVPPLPTEDK